MTEKVASCREHMVAMGTFLLLKVADGSSLSLWHSPDVNVFVDGPLVGVFEKCIFLLNILSICNRHYDQPIY